MRLPGGEGARLEVDNHARSGPVFAGSQVQPWLCMTEDNGLGPARDPACSVPPSSKLA